MHTFEDLKEIVAVLRSEHGCPWDRKQTLESLKPYLLEESGEVLEAIDHHDMENLCEELGDVLYQVMIQSQIASEQGLFTVEDVIDGLCEKMITPMYSGMQWLIHRRKVSIYGMRLKSRKKPKKLDKEQ